MAHTQIVSHTYVSDVSGKPLTDDEVVVIRAMYGDHMYVMEAGADEVEDILSKARKTNRPGRKKAGEDGAAETPKDEAPKDESKDGDEAPKDEAPAKGKSK